MNLEPLRIGLIGCGKQAPKHIEGLRSTGRPVDISVYDTNCQAVAALASNESVTPVESLEVILNDSGIGAVIIATPTPYHHDLIVAALQAGKHAFCEKPLCATLAEAESIEEASRRAGKFVQVGYVYRFVPAFRFLHDLLANRAQPLGRLVLALLRLGGRGSHSVWKHRSSSGGGAINEVLVHILDLAGWLFGPIDHALWHQKLLLRSERVIDGARVSADAEDFVLVTTQGRGGIHIVLQADLLTPAFQQTLEVNGEAGSFLGSIEPQHPSFIHLLETRGEFAAGRRSLSFPQENLFHSQMRNFVENILRGTLVDCATVADSLQLLKIVEQARAS